VSTHPLAPFAPANVATFMHTLDKPLMLWYNNSMKTRKVTKKMSGVSAMWATLKRDLHNSSTISYDSNGLHLIVEKAKDNHFPTGKGQRVEWSLEGKTLCRYSDFVWTKGKTSVSHFDCSALWGKYLAVRLVGTHGALYEMFRVW